MNIQAKFDYIILKAKELEEYFQDEDLLYKSLNSLDRAAIDEIIETGQPRFDKSNNLYFGPVILVRDKVARLLQQGIRINADTIDEIKDRFISKDVEFFSEYSAQIQEAIKEYEIGESSPFRAWKKNFRILYTFFFRSSVKENVNSYLKDVSDFLITELKLRDFRIHWVNFDGVQNFGSTRCWLALFPSYKVNHTNAYQFFLSIQHDGIAYGIVTGSEIKRRVGKNKDLDVEELDSTKDFQDVLIGFANKKEDISSLNKKIKQVWKFAPGENAKYWDDLSAKSIMAIGWSELENLNNYPTVEDIAEAMGTSVASNSVWNPHLFRNASVGDIVVANRGRKEVVGIGVISGDYEYQSDRSYFKHVRKVDWIINKSIKFDKTIFRADTFSPTLKYARIRDEYLRQFPELKDRFKRIEGEFEVFRETGEEADEKAYFWLNANAKIWNYMDYRIGETQTYTSKNLKGNKRRVYQHFLDANPGDVLVGYLTSPFRQIVAMLEVTKSLYQDDIEGEVIEFKINEFLENPVEFDVLKSNPELKNAEPIINNQGSLFKLRDDEFEIIQNIIEENNPQLGKISKVATEEYTLEEALEDSGFGRTRFEEIVALLDNKKQIVIQGAPGTGKTYFAEIIAKFLVKSEDNFEIIQFHPSYSYEDFVEGYRPSESRGLSLKNGIFKDICHRALIYPKEKFALIIDEINRGDISKIFGELLYLLEYRNKKIRLTYSPDIEFQIPKNIYIIGTMNLADRSLALIDYALRRRFSFITLEPDYDLIRKFNRDSDLVIDHVIDNIKDMNNRISAEHSLGKDFVIGHSYFLDKLKNELSLDNVWRYEVEPLLLEYFFDAKDDVEALKTIFFKNVTN